VRKVCIKQGEALPNLIWSRISLTVQKQLQNRSRNSFRTGAETCSRTGAETGPQTVSETNSPRNQDGNDCVAEDIFFMTMEAPKFTPP